MSLALYRKYRPASFAEVMGQAHVTDPLRRALVNNRISHAYLFSGPRGCGKTSSARIMARSLNCAKGPTPDPCGECDSCVALAPNGPGSLDVIEIDAASHNGVDDARDLRERAFFAPVSSRFKVYIIDEAHMVTTAAFNALLKLVEEPPDFVKFVFATTEPENVLQTIRSRTHHYPFRLMSPKALTDLLARVVAAEGIAVDSSVLPLVVRAAAGSARDGLSILDQVLASAGPQGVTRDGAAALLGVTPDTLLDGIVDAFAAVDAAAVFALLDQVMEGGHDPRRFATDVLERLRDLVILDAVPDAGSSGLLDCPADQLERMSRQAAAMGTAGLSRAADLLHAGLVEMRGKTAPRLLLELVCARVLLPAASAEDSALLTRLERLERRLEIAGAPAPVAARAAAPAPVVAAPAPPASPKPPVSPPAAPPPPAAAWPTPATLGGSPSNAPPPVADIPAAAPAAPGAGGLDAAALRTAWTDVLVAVKERKRTAHAQLADAQVKEVTGRTLVLGFQHAPILRQFQASTGPDVLHEALQASLGADLDVKCVLHDTRTGSAPPEPVHPEFAPGDEVVPEDPDAPPPPERARGEDAALELVRSQLGGRVVSTSTEP
ncbi:MAG: DNA polymerase III subunit gamma and tau [Actinobacteria bacterium]|nr:DNA polymerase III subunit gamma and tau [Actinomycetota bacterium]MBW3647760.1 DNA polymerase III subunit gamma and tau [Actinomycetota bacterium]